MAKQEKGSDQTEKPTPKRLLDARKDGDVAKSKELTSTVILLAWLAMAWLAVPFAVHEVTELFERTFDAIGRVGSAPVPALWIQAFKTLLVVSIPLLLFAIAVGLLTEFLQVGGLFAPKRMSPQADRLNPVEGMKRMFSQDNLIDVVSSFLKTAGLVIIAYLVLMRMMPEVLRLMQGQPKDVAAAHWHGLKWMGIWTVCVFFGVAVADAGYRKYAYIKRLRMSRRDIKREMRDTEGDPYIKGHRKRLHQEWAQQNMLATVRQATAVVVNPEHIAIAIVYDPKETALPVVCAKGEDYEAQLIREAAEEAGVPIMRNVALARGLHENVGVNEYISAEFFQAVAELLRWAEGIRSGEIMASPDQIPR